MLKHNKIKRDKSPLPTDDNELQFTVAHPLSIPEDNSISTIHNTTPHPILAANIKF